MVLQDFGRGRVSACTGIRSVVLNCYNQRRVSQQNRTIIIIVRQSDARWCERREKIPPTRFARMVSGAI